MENEYKTKKQLISELETLRSRIAEFKSAETPYKQTKTIQWRTIWLSITGVLILLCILVWLNEILDLPHRLLGAPRTPINWREAIIEMVFVALGGFFAVSKLIHDAGKYKHAEQKIEHLNLVLRAIRKVEQLVIREKDRERLLQGACNSLIENRGYHNAWIALLDVSGTLLTAAQAGLGKDFLSMVEQLKRGELTHCAHSALKQSRVVVIQDPFSHCTDCPLARMYAGRGAMTVRLEHAGKVYGFLSISIPRDLVEDQEEQALVEEVAGDIAFALHGIELEEERRLAEKKIIEAKEMAEAASRAKSEFLTNMSHEIRTPMNGVIAAADLALSEEISPKMEHYLKIIHSSAYSLLEIFNEILDFSEIEAGKLGMESRPFKLNEVLNSITDMFIHKAAEKRIEFLVDIDPETPKLLIGDPLRLQQILKNLVDNAVKFTEKDGVILVGVKPPQISLNEVTLTFFVKDTGVGIAPENIARLFKPFTQVDGTTTRKYGGIGLGLVICKRLVEMMHGKILVESELGKGSTFTFTARFGRHRPTPERKPVIPSPARQPMEAGELPEKLPGINIRDQLVPLLKQLANALELANPEEIKKHMEAIRQHLDSTILQNLENQINAYDYDEALITLKGIEESMVEQLGRKAHNGGKEAFGFED